MSLKTISFIVFSTTCSFLSPVFGYAAGQSRGPGNYFSAFRQRDAKDPSKWPSNNYLNYQKQRPARNQLQPYYNYVDRRTSMYKFNAPDGDHISRVLEVQKPHNEIVKNENSEDLLLDRAALCNYEEYVDDESDNDSDYQSGKFNVYFPDGRPQNIDFEGKILNYPQY